MSNVPVLATLLIAFLLGHSSAIALEEEKLSSGVVGVGAFELPPSSYMSEEAAAALADLLKTPPPYPSDNSKEAILAYRAQMDETFYKPRLRQVRAIYSPHIQESEIAGVPVTIVRPSEKEDAEDKRLLIALHGGGFRAGAGMGALIEAIPVAVESGITVVSIDYRQYPEAVFPAASEDVAAVYEALLADHRADQIGMFGCSAGGMLAAMSVAWFKDHDLPQPGAVGIFCAGADVVVGGDARYLSNAASGYPAPPASPNPPPTGMQYLDATDIYTPLASPAFHPDYLAEFPPALLISGTRDGALSSAVHTHTELTRLGVESDLHVWDGMWHGFLYDVTLPETQAAFDVIADFFNAHLAKGAE